MNNYEVQIERTENELNKAIKSIETIESKSYNFDQGFVHFYDDNEEMVASFPTYHIISIKKQD